MYSAKRKKNLWKLLLDYPLSILRSGKALKDMIDYIKETISLVYDVGTVPVFTRLGEKILNKIPGLIVNQRGRQVTLTADNEV